MRLFEGEHLLVASMTVNGIKYTATTTINVSPAPVTNQATIEDFENPSSLNNVLCSDMPFTYAGDYEGRTGVMKFDIMQAISDYPGITIQQPLANTNWKTEYTVNDYVAVDMFISGSCAKAQLVSYGTSTSDYLMLARAGELVTGEWHTYYFKMTRFLSDENYGKAFFYFIPDANEKDFAVYIDKIYAVKKAAAYDSATIEDFDHGYALQNVTFSANYGMSYPYALLDSYDNHTGVLKLDLTQTLNCSPQFTIENAIGNANWSAEYSASSYIAIEMKVEGNIPNGMAICNNENGFYYLDGILVNGWHTYYLSLGQLKFLETGKVVAFFTGGIDGDVPFGVTVYIDRIYASPARPAIEANTIEDFNHPVSMSNLVVHEMPVEYLDSYEGKTGILKLDLTAEEAEYPKFQIGAPIGTVNKNNFTEGYIAIDMYVEGTIPGGAIIGNVYNSSLYWQDGALVSGWHTYYLSLEKLQFLNYNVVEACFAKSDGGAFGITVYIDRIYAVTQAEKDAATNL